MGFDLIPSPVQYRYRERQVIPLGPSRAGVDHCTCARAGDDLLVTDHRVRRCLRGTRGHDDRSKWNQVVPGTHDFLLLGTTVYSIISPRGERLFGLSRAQQGWILRRQPTHWKPLSEADRLYAGQEFLTVGVADDAISVRKKILAGRERRAFRRRAEARRRARNRG